MIYRAWIYAAFEGFRVGLDYGSFTHEKWFESRGECVDWIADEMGVAS